MHSSRNQAIALFCVALAVIWTSATALAQSYVAGSPPNDATAAKYFPYHFTTVSNIKYGSGSSQVGDIWLPNYSGQPTPANSTSRPAVVVVHGGGGTSGSRNSTRELQISGFCASHGYVAFNIDYPIGAVYPQNIQSWRLAVRFLRANAATYGIDPNHIGITGGSFGGYCSGFLSGITNGQHTIEADSNSKYNNASLDLDSAGDLAAYSGDIQCGIDLYGPMDQVTSGNAGGQYSSPTTATLFNSSPVNYVHATSAPLMIAHGTADTTVSISQSKTMTNRLGQLHVPYQFCVVQNAAHTFYYYQSSGGSWPPGNSALDLRATAFDWFDKYLLAAANPPVISVQPTPQSGCSGYAASFSVTVTGTSPLHYQWSGPSGVIANATNATYTIASLSGVNVGNYFVTITNSFGSVTSSSVALVVNTATPPGITVQPANTSVLAGNATNLIVVATGDALQYQWSGPNGVIANATNATYTITNAANSDAGSYSVVVYNSCNAVTSSNAILTVNGPPSITGQPLSVITCTGTSASLFAAANGTAPLSYQWYGVINGIISGATSNSLTLNNLSVADSDNYYLVVTNAFGSANSSNALLTVSANSNVTITSDATNTEVAAGGTAIFSVSVSGGGPYTYVWLKNDYDTISNNPSATTATLVLTNVTAADSAYYHCFINNDCFTASSTNATLVVDVAPTITQQPLSSTNNVNATVTLSVTADGTLPISYQWRTNGVNLANATNSTLVFNSIQTFNAGAYDVIVANNFGSVTSAVANVSVNISTTGSIASSSAASVQSAANAALDIDEQTAGYVKVKFSTVTGTGTGMAKGYYGFDLTGQNPNTNSPATLNVPCLSASGATHIQVWGLLQAYPGMANNITWNTAQANDTTTNGMLTSGGFTAATIGTNTPCAGGAVTNVITLPAGWGQFIVSNKLVLVLTPANPTGDSANGFRPNITNLPVLAFNLAGQITTPTISTQPSSLAVCSNTPVNFTVVAGGAQPLSYQWQYGGVNINPGANPSAATATLSLTSPSPANNGNYQVIITNSYGAVTSSIASLTVSADPPVNVITPPANTSGVLGGSASFTVAANGGTLTYQWYQGATPISGGTNATLNLSNLTTNSAGSYTVLINNSCGNASQSATLTINTPPVITQQPANQSVFVGGSASFSVTATGTTPLVYQWRSNSVPINGANNITYTLTGATTNQSGYAFDVIITNNFGSVTSSPAATLTVSPITSSGTVVISEVYAGGGKTGAPYKYDYVVLKNISANPVSINGWSLQHDKVGVWQTPFALPNATLPAGGYYLIQCYNDGSAGTNGSNLPAPDATATQSSVWNMSYASADAVALVNNTTTLTSCSSSSVVDLVGAGTATGNCYLGSGVTPAGASATLAMTRAGGGCQNIGDNSIDFATAAPSPKNSATTPVSCAIPNQPPTITTQPLSHVTSGPTTSFSVAVAGTAPFAYQWFAGVSPISGATNISYVLNNVTSNNSGNTFYVVVTNIYGAATSSVAVLTFNPYYNELLSLEAVKSHYYLQTNTTAVDLPVASGGTYSWAAEAQGILPAQITGTTVSYAGTNLPNPFVQSAMDDTGLAQDELLYGTKNALDAAFNNGNYHYVTTFDSGNTYVNDLPLGTNGDAYPNVPTLTAPVGDWSAGKLTVHAVTGGYALSWVPLTAPQDQINIAINDAAGNAITELDGLPGNITNYVLPGSILDPNKDYQLELTFTHMNYRGTNAVGTILYGLFEANNDFTVHTDPTGVAGGVQATNYATIRNGTNSLNDINEQAFGYLMAKYSTNGSSAKAYLQFNLAGANYDATQPATLRLYPGTGGGSQRIQIWALNQAFTAPTNLNNLNWNQAPANDTNGNSMLTSGAATASLLTDVQLANTTNEIIIPAPWGQFVFNNQVTLVIGTSIAIAGDVNSSAGFRVAATNGVPLPTLRFSSGPNYTQFQQAYDAGLGLFGGENVIFTNTSGLTFYAWASADPTLPVSSWNLEGTMNELPLGTSGNSRFGINLNPGASPVYYIFATTNAGPYLATENLAWLTTDDYVIFNVNGTNMPISTNGIFAFAQAPTISQNPVDQTVVTGGNASFNVVASGSAPLFYQWRKGGFSLAGSTNLTLQINGVTAPDAGAYDVVVSNFVGSVTSSVAMLIISNPPPVITQQPTGRTVLVGQSAGFTVSATGTGLGYQWLFNSSNVAGANLSNLTLTNVSLAQAGNYSVRVTNTSGAVTSSNALLQVSLPPQLSVSSGSPGTIQFSGNSITGLTYVVQQNTNLGSANWVPVFTNNTGGSGTYNFSTNSTGATSVFYRLMFP